MQISYSGPRWSPHLPVRLTAAAAVATGILMASTSVVPATAATGYTVHELAPVAGHVFEPTGLNDAGQVAGLVFDNNISHALLYDARTMTARRLNPADGDHSAASDVNNRGQVVGNQYLDGGGTVRAFIWTARHPVLRDLEPDAPAGSDIAVGTINDHGVISGSAQFPGTSHARARVWRVRHGRIRAIDVGGRLGLPFSAAAGVSDKGQVLVDYVGERGNLALLWRPGGRVRQINPLPGDDSVSGAGINSDGVVIGYSVSTDDLLHDRPFRWDPRTGKTTALAVMAGNKITRAAVIGSTGVVAGQVVDLDTGAVRAVAWSADGTTVAVLPGQESTSHNYGRANGIDELGRIVGWTVDDALLWTPRPRT